ncbi:hypothetical protein CTEN210_06981 [Chaetoceros tenuissimus]|uniref:Uncharacterized protein n=1 Tax=Chaetoceros tenuissimus TaxID=426638 RepID=A0AAD3CTC8_9STRA|nr:hypothetical protein CTEN210_06981 [Chaetoceros tenuissimus]
MDYFTPNRDFVHAGSIVLSAKHSTSKLTGEQTIPPIVHIRHEESVRRLNTLSNFYGTADPMATDYDIWAEMKAVTTDLPKLSAKATWVKGHQDDSTAYEDLLFEARENIAMDKKCEEMRQSDEQTPPIPYFSSERAQVLVGGTPITQQLRYYIHIYTEGSPLHDYICRKLSWSRDTFDKVNWPALELYLKNLPGDKRTNVIKMQHGWIFTAERDHLFQSKTTAEYETRTESPCCPFKCNDIDYKWHFLTCKKSPLHSQVTKELKPFIQTMRSLQSDPNIMSVILNRLRTFLKGLPHKRITLPQRSK